MKELVSLLPESPGVYQFLNSEGTVIYVGKAKNLKRRVSSYFLSSRNHGRKVLALVRNIADIRHTVVQSEGDALLLENNMIKSLQPKYNILLKDDKTFPWIVVKNEPVPRILSTRQLVKDGSRYFGPYTSVGMQKAVLDLVQKLYFVRTCHLPLTEEGIRRGKFSLCLEYHIGNCKAPCVGKQSLEEYRQNIRVAEDTLKGNLREAKNYLQQEMERAAAGMRFEEAQRVKERLAMLERYESKSIIVSPLLHDIDVFSLVIDGSSAYCNYMHLSKGAVIYSYTIEMKLNLEESFAAVLSFAIGRILDKIERQPAKEVIVPELPEEGDFPGVTFTVPQRGDKLKLLQLSEKNARLFRLEKLKQIEKKNPERHTQRIMEQMKRELNLDELPRRIECFDNSNIQGTYPVSSCVVFINGRPAKKEYRHFNIKTVVGIDDFASMKETLLRRYSRVLEEGAPLPQLIVVDGGKGQLSSAYEVLCRLGLEKRIRIVGLAKRMEEIYFPHDPYPLCLDKSGETLRVLMHIRDEAHRFGITFHRNKRSAGAIKSELEDIPTLGPRSIEKLLRRFRSVAKIREASPEELAETVGKSRAEAIRNYFDKGGPVG